MYKIGEVIKGLEDIDKAMNANQCYACNHEWVEESKDFITNIIPSTIEFIKKQDRKIEEYKLAIIVLTKLIEKQTTVKNGHWIEEQPNTYTRRTKCSECDASAPFICVSDDYYGSRNHGETRKTKYCPNCGARME